MTSDRGRALVAKARERTAYARRVVDDERRAWGSYDKSLETTVINSSIAALCEAVEALCALVESMCVYVEMDDR